MELIISLTGFTIFIGLAAVSYSLDRLANIIRDKK